MKRNPSCNFYIFSMSVQCIAHFSAVVLKLKKRNKTKISYRKITFSVANMLVFWKIVLFFLFPNQYNFYVLKHMLEKGKSVFGKR